MLVDRKLPFILFIQGDISCCSIKGFSFCATCVLHHGNAEGVVPASLLARDVCDEGWLMLGKSSP